MLKTGGLHCCLIGLLFQQHPPSLHPQEGSFPVNQLFMTADAQPTPALTWIALVGQFRAHAPHSMHRSFSTIQAVSSFMANTP